MISTEQEHWWAGAAGNDYLARNRVDWQKRIPFWRHILGLTQANSVLEAGANAGWNLRAIKAIDAEIAAFGVEINEAALHEANAAGLKVFPASAVEVGDLWPGEFDLTCSVGMLIHVPPAQLREAMAAIAAASNRWVLAVEYAADAQEEISYRGHAERLWKRPYGQLYADIGLKVVATGEAPAEAFDRCHWWLCERP